MPSEPGGAMAVTPESNQSQPERGTMPRELIEFLIELSIAFQKFAIYPAGHPMLATTVERLERKLHPVLDPRDMLSLGVARHQIVIDGVGSDEGHNVLRDLAQRLHDHHLGALRISRGVTAPELRELLLAVSAEQGKDAVPLGLRGAGALPEWPNVRLFPTAYEHLELLDDDEAGAPIAGERRRVGGTRAVRLWVGLARAALSSAESAELTEDELADAGTVARAIDEHERDPAYDQVIVGYLPQIADELRVGEGRDVSMLRSRASRLIESLSPATLRHLLSIGNDAAQRRKLMLDATQGLSVRAALVLLRAAAGVARGDISEPMTRLLDALAHRAEQDASDRRIDADAALRDIARMQLADWAHERTAAPSSVDDERMLQLALEIGVAGGSTWRAAENMIARRRLPTLLSTLEKAPRPRAADNVWARIATPERVRALIDEPQPDWLSLERLVVRVGLPAADALCDSLESVSEPRRQGQLVNLLAKLGEQARETVVRRIPRARPEVQAQLLALLGRSGDLPPELDPSELARSPTPAVRREAVKLLCRRAETREEGIRIGLLDGDERTVLAALNETASGCPASVVPILMNRVDRDDIPASLRALAIRAAASVSSPEVLDWVLRFVMVGRKRFFGGERLAPKSPELLAAVAALATHWRSDPRANEVLDRAARSSDIEIRAATLAGARVPNARQTGTMRAVEEDA